MKKPVVFKVQSISTKMQQNTTGQGPWARLSVWTSHTLNWLCLISHNWKPFKNMMTSSNGMTSRVTGPLCGEFTGDSTHKGQWRGALMFSLICAWINRWVNNRDAGDLRRHRAHYGVIVMQPTSNMITHSIQDNHGACWLLRLNQHVRCHPLYVETKWCLIKIHTTHIFLSHPFQYW